MIKNFIFVLMTFVSSAALASAPDVQAKFNLFPAGHFTAETTKVVGQAVAKGAKFLASNIVVDLTSLSTGISMRDKHLKEKLQTDKFPTATLVTGEGENGKGKGKITIRGITKDIEGSYKDLGDGFAQATFPLKITDFNLEQPKYLGVEVEDQFEVTVTVPVKK